MGEGGHTPPRPATLANNIASTVHGTPSLPTDTSPFSDYTSIGPQTHVPQRPTTTLAARLRILAADMEPINIAIRDALLGPRAPGSRKGEAPPATRDQ